MKSNTMAALVAAMIALSLAPMASAVPKDPCTETGIGPPDDDPHDGDGACKTIAGPSTLDIKNILTVGVGICHDTGGTLPPNLPLDCNNGPGDIAGAGAFVVKTTGCMAPEGCIYKIWAAQAPGVEATGWGVSPCSDRDDDGVCTNVALTNDDFGHDGYQGTVVSGSAKTGDKGPEWAHTEFCVRTDQATVAAGGDYDDFWVFITSWIDVSFGGNVGTGIGFGLFDVIVEYHRDADASVGDSCMDTHSFTGDP